MGYARAARILDLLEQEGFIGPADGAKPREILKADFTKADPLTANRRAIPAPGPEEDEEEDLEDEEPEEDEETEDIGEESEEEEEEDDDDARR